MVSDLAPDLSPHKQAVTLDQQPKLGVVRKFLSPECSLRSSSYSSDSYFDPVSSAPLASPPPYLNASNDVFIFP